MSTPFGSNVDSTHKNIEGLVQKISALQKEEEATQKKLLAHEETRNEMCPGDNNTTTGSMFTTDHHTQYQTPCCSWKDQSKHTGDDRVGGAEIAALSFANVDNNSAGKSVTTSLGNTHMKGQECLFKQNGAEAYSQQLMDQIHRLAEERASLFKTLLNIYANVQRDVSETRSDLVDQLTVVGVVEQELTNARSNLDALGGAKNNKNRMALINTYYGKRYQAHTGIMKMIIMICVPLLILAIVGKKGIIGDNITRPLALIVIIVGGFFLFRRIWDLSSRDNMNYDEYNWDFDPDNVKPTVFEYDKEQLDKSDMGDRISSDLHTLASDLGVECIGPNCCSTGMKYDHKQNKCVEDKSHHDNNALHHRRAAADAKKQVEAFDVMRPIEGTSNVLPSGCHPMPSTVRPYTSQDDEQYAKVA